MDTAKNLFPSLEEIDGEKLSFEYYDKDGDVITYAQKELKVALNEMRGGDLLKFEIITILKSHPKVTAFDEFQSIAHTPPRTRNTKPSK